MNHLSEDKLLEYALEIIDRDSERADVAAHLATCPECSARLANIRKDIEIIGSVRPSGRVLPAPNPRTGHAAVYAIIRIAALIIFGIFVGFAGSNWLHQEPAEVTPAYFTLAPPEDPLSGGAVTDATLISARCYDEILQDQE